MIKHKNILVKLSRMCQSRENYLKSQRGEICGRYSNYAIALRNYVFIFVRIKTYETSYAMHCSVLSYLHVLKKVDQAR